MRVFYSEKTVAISKSYSPSASKPRFAVQSWLDHHFDIEVIEPVPVSLEQLCGAHAAKYVNGVLSLREANGFGDRSPSVAESLRYTSGALLDAARDAISTGGFSCAPVSGFHHAGYDFGGGFCTFNGLMVTAIDLLHSATVLKVGILDCDQHFGNGTEDIIERLDLRDDVIHYTSGQHSLVASTFLEGLPDLMESLYSDCGVLLYQAGADAHVDDPLGGWMTTDQLRARDHLVFSTAKKMGLPVCWDLAGGYQRDASGGIAPVLAIHDNTMIACLAVVA